MVGIFIASSNGYFVTVTKATPNVSVTSLLVSLQRHKNVIGYIATVKDAKKIISVSNITNGN